MEYSKRRPALQQLQKQWSLLSIIMYGMLLLLFFILTELLGFSVALSWFIPAAVLAGVQLAEIRRFLPENHRPDGTALFRRLGAGNIVSNIRGFLFVCVGGFLLSPSLPGVFRWVPGLLYTTGIFLDRFDGYLARKSGQVTVMGAQIDMRFDALGILIATLLGLQWGRLPWWYISVGMAFYVYDLGLRSRRRRQKPVRPLPENPNRPVLAGMQMGFLAVSLWPVFSPAVLHTAALVFGLPLVVTFIRDWLFASGRMDPESGWYQRFIRIAGKISRTLVLPGIRLGIVTLVLPEILGIPEVFGSLESLSLMAGIPISGNGIALILGVLSLGLLAGILTRISALGIMVVSGVFIMAASAFILPRLLLVAAGILLLYGPGRWKLLDWEERLLYRTDSPTTPNRVRIS